MRLKSFGSVNGPRSSGSSTSIGRFGRGFGRSGLSSQNKALILGAIGAVWIGLFATVGVRALSNNPVQEAPQQQETVIIQREAPPEMIDVLVPVRDIQNGAPLQPEDFIRVSRPRIAVSDGAIKGYDELRGAYARSLIPAHQPLVRDFVTKDQPGNSVIANIPVGFRAVTINVNATTSVEGWARGGARVDIHWIADIVGERTARKLVENAKVLSAERRVDQQAAPETPVPTTVTLLVTERDAQKVSLAATAGSLVLHLRGASDIQGGALGGVLTLRDLLGKGSMTEEKNVEGVVRFKDKGGQLKEYAIVDGSVMKRKES